MDDLVKIKSTHEKARKYAHQLAEDIALDLCIKDFGEFRLATIKNNTSPSLEQLSQS